jgi:hypothetical protein
MTPTPPFLFMSISNPVGRCAEPPIVADRLRQS